MTRVQYNGGPDVFVGKSTEPKPTAEHDGITEGAVVINRDNSSIEFFSGDDTEGWNKWGDS